MEVTTKTITPKQAKRLLEKNTRNRKPSEKQIDFLAREMAEGRWKLNGDAIRMNGSELIDGQHRLMACIKSGKSFETLFVTGLEADVFHTIDTGKKRTIADVLSIEGYVNTTLLASAAGYVRQYKEYGNFTRPRYSAEEIILTIEDNPALEASVRFTAGFKLAKFIPVSMFAALHYLCWEKDDILADMFFERLAKGADITADEPLFVLRERLQANALSSRKLEKEVIAALIIKAWNAEWQGKQIKILRFNKSEEFPTICE